MQKNKMKKKEMKKGEDQSKNMEVINRNIEQLRIRNMIPKCSTFHSLKTKKMYFGDYWNGARKATVRFNDRKFKKGDTICLRETSYSNYTGNEIMVWVSHVQKNFTGIQKGYCVVSFEIIGQFGPKTKIENKQKKKKG